MTATVNPKLLEDILNEVNKYKWYESEKAGADIGFERASREWIHSYSKDFLANHSNKTSFLSLKASPVAKFLKKEIAAK